LRILNMAVRNIFRGATKAGGYAGTTASAPIYCDSDDSKIKFIPGGQGSTTEVEVLDNSTVGSLANKTFPFVTISGDGAVTLVPSTVYLTKGSAAAITVAAPGTAGIGTVITITTGSNFAHVVTFTGTTLNDGTAGANSTWTSAAVQGSSITFVGVTATLWNVVSFNLGTIAP
jgi:hypothetical protein